MPCYVDDAMEIFDKRLLKQVDDIYIDPEIRLNSHLNYLIIRERPDVFYDIRDVLFMLEEENNVEAMVKLNDDIYVFYHAIEGEGGASFIFLSQRPSLLFALFYPKKYYKANNTQFYVKFKRNGISLRPPELYEFFAEKRWKNYIERNENFRYIPKLFISDHRVMNYVLVVMLPRDVWKILPEIRDYIYLFDKVQSMYTYNDVLGFEKINELEEITENS